MIEYYWCSLFHEEHGAYNKSRFDIKYKEEIADRYVMSSIGLAYDYKYNGKELLDELGLNWYDYSARNYDAVIGRWMIVDPLVEGRSEMTPKHFVRNNLINRIDSDGRWDDWYVDGKGCFC